MLFIYFNLIIYLSINKLIFLSNYPSINNLSEYSSINNLSNYPSINYLSEYSSINNLTNCLSLFYLSIVGNKPGCMCRRDIYYSISTGNLSIYLYIYQSVYRSIYLSIYLSTHPSICLSQY